MLELVGLNEPVNNVQPPTVLLVDTRLSASDAEFEETVPVLPSMLTVAAELNALVTL